MNIDSKIINKKKFDALYKKAPQDTMDKFYNLIVDIIDGEISEAEEFFTKKGLEQIITSKKLQKSLLAQFDVQVGGNPIQEEESSTSEESTPSEAEILPAPQLSSKKQKPLIETSSISMQESSDNFLAESEEMLFDENSNDTEDQSEIENEETDGPIDVEDRINSFLESE
jgi:hypothetical protein